MKFWPLSVIVQSPLLPPAYAPEVSQIGSRMPSQGAFYACFDVARMTPSIDAPSLVVIETVGGPVRRAYVDYPDDDEWLRLERTTVMEAKDGYMFVLIDALH